MKILIDADLLKHNWVDHFDSMYGKDCAEMFKKAIDEQPEVIDINHIIKKLEKAYDSSFEALDWDYYEACMNVRCEIADVIDVLEGVSK